MVLMGYGGMVVMVTHYERHFRSVCIKDIFIIKKFFINYVKTLIMM